MGQLVNGVWTKGSVSNNQKDGSFRRVDSVFRNVISVNDQVYKPETNRYHLYVSYACPWAHRTLIFRHLKKLENHISVDYVHPDMLENGWSFLKTFPKSSMFGERNPLLKSRLSCVLLVGLNSILKLPLKDPLLFFI